jgi:hypothetical protein
MNAGAQLIAYAARLTPALHVVRSCLPSSRARAREANNREAEQDRLYRQIGKLQMEVDWLRKETGHLD